jgi:porin
VLSVWSIQHLFSARLPSDQPAAGEPPLLERQYLTGDWHGMRPALSAHGFEPYLTYTGMLWMNLGGGHDTGGQVNGYLDFGMDVDLAKLGTWDGFRMHADFHWWQGDEPTSELIGGTAAMTLSGWEAATPSASTMLPAGCPRGSFAHPARSDRRRHRLHGLTLCQYPERAFGDLPSQNLNIDAPVYPLAAPGVFALGRPWPWLSGRFGAYTGDPGNDVAGNHGFEWKLGNNAGYTFFSELAGSPPDPLLPAVYTLGGIYDTEPGQSAPALKTAATTSSPHTDQALVMNAWRIRQSVVRAHQRSPQSARNVWHLCRCRTGAVRPCIAPNDVLRRCGLRAALHRGLQQQARGAGAPIGSGETVIEITYQVAIAPWLVAARRSVLLFIQPRAVAMRRPWASRWWRTSEDAKTGSEFQPRMTRISRIEDRNCSSEKVKIRVIRVIRGHLPFCVSRGSFSLIPPRLPFSLGVSASWRLSFLSDQG